MINSPAAGHAMAWHFITANDIMLCACMYGCKCGLVCVYTKQLINTQGSTLGFVFECAKLKEKNTARIVDVINELRNTVIAIY